MLDRKFTRTGFTSQDVAGHAVDIERGSASLDFYVVGFMCTPFSPKGKRQGWADEAAKTLFSAMRTVGALRPKAGR
jgi:site-specific DNA-cytosine methylase